MTCCVDVSILPLTYAHNSGINRTHVPAVAVLCVRTHGHTWCTIYTSTDTTIYAQFIETYSHAHLLSGYCHCSACTHTYIYSYIHTCIHTHTYIYIRVPPLHCMRAWRTIWGMYACICNHVSCSSCPIVPAKYVCARKNTYACIVCVCVCVCTSRFAHFACISMYTRMRSRFVNAYHCTDFSDRHFNAHLIHG
jgi:hypothetical protein